MKLEERHYTLFKDECNRWIKFFGFSDWEIDFRFDDTMDVCASCAVNIAAHAAMLSLAVEPVVDYDVPDIDEYVRQSAFHEVCELLLFEFELTALNDKLPRKERAALVDARRHGIVHRLSAIYKHVKGEQNG